MKYLIFLFSFFLAFTQTAVAQQHKLSGDWNLELYQGSTQLDVSDTHFEYKNGHYHGTLSIHGHTFPFKKVRTTKDDSVFIYQVKGVPAETHYKGRFKNDSLITGNIYQKGHSFDFKMKRSKPAEKKEEKSKPYHHKDIIIGVNDSIQLGGTLTWPEDQPTRQLVITLSGSGIHNRDEEIYGFKIFGQMANYLARHGIAVFRYNDRGVGESTGELKLATIDMLASDVKTIVSYFSGKSNHCFKTIALLGHSKGGMVDGKVAAEDTLVNKLILMSSPGDDLQNSLNHQARRLFVKAGIPKKLYEPELKARKNIMKSVIKGKNIKKARKNYRSKFKPIQVFGGADSTTALTIAKQQAQSLTKAYRMPSMKSMLLYKPADNLRQLNIPVLALFGGKDTEVPVSIGLPATRSALNSAGVSYQINVFKNANHLYQQAKTGAPSEYETLPKRFVKGFLPTITNWLNKLKTDK